ncbi:hypothetical protein XELAEV_18042112mg [Xenopus laevis]|uniref:Uncharacterized protein n=1 Tax=Xenopus laevis TaxID=8355 RepID=A0A974C3L3_XENLA|nr:hypothetical protein XELAEV_18042112mg [Xenopus laevis]
MDFICDILTLYGQCWTEANGPATLGGPHTTPGPSAESTLPPPPPSHNPPLTYSFAHVQGPEREVRRAFGRERLWTAGFLVAPPARSNPVYGYRWWMRNAIVAAQFLYVNY